MYSKVILSKIILFLLYQTKYQTVIIHFGSTTSHYLLLLFWFWSISDNKLISLAFFIQSIYIKSENAQSDKICQKKCNLREIAFLFT